MAQLATSSPSVQPSELSKVLSDTTSPLPHANITAFESPASGPASRIMRRTIDEAGQINPTIGLAAVVAACLLSGYASVYFERQLKKPPQASTEQSSIDEFDDSPISYARKINSLWIKNIQLSLFSLAIGVVIYFLEVSCEKGPSRPFLSGFTSLAYFVVFLQVTGGLLAALVIKHADNIAKTFATSASIVLTFMVSMAMHDAAPSLGSVAGGAAVIASTVLFGEPV